MQKSLGDRLRLRKSPPPTFCLTISFWTKRLGSVLTVFLEVKPSDTSSALSM